MLEKAYREGKLHAIGLSNFPPEKIQEILDQCSIAPAVMQAEGHPYYPAEQVKPFCDSHDIVVQCWFPLGHGSQQLLNDPVIAGLRLSTIRHRPRLFFAGISSLAFALCRAAERLRIYRKTQRSSTLLLPGRYAADRGYQPAYALLPCNAGVLTCAGNHEM